jgi:sigma-E factor negative regulatory protein RseA
MKRDLDSLEHLSSLMDGEIERDTGKFLVRRLGVDEQMRATWDRYHLIRDCLRHADDGVAATSLTDRVSLALSDEPADTAAPGRSWSAGRWLRPVAGVAVAASVALMAVWTVSSPVGQAPGADSPATAAAEPAQPFTSPNLVVSAPQSRPANLSGMDDTGHRRMNSYLLRHYQVAGSKSGRGFVSFVPIVVAKPTAVGQSSATLMADKGPSDSADDAAPVAGDEQVVPRP